MSYMKILTFLFLCMPLLVYATPPDNRPPDNRPPDFGGGDSVATAEATGGTATSAATVGDITLNLNNDLIIPDSAFGLMSQPSTMAVGDTNVSVITQNPDHLTIKNVPSGRAATAISTSPCRIAIAGDVRIVGLGLGGGASVEDKECTTRQTALAFSHMGVPAMGLWIMCRSQGTQRAYRSDPPDVEEDTPIDQTIAEQCDAMVAQFQILADLGRTPDIISYTVSGSDKVQIIEQHEEQLVEPLREEMSRVSNDVASIERRLDANAKAAQTAYREKEVWKAETAERYGL